MGAMPSLQESEWSALPGRRDEVSAGARCGESFGTAAFYYAVRMANADVLRGRRDRRLGVALQRSPLARQPSLRLAGLAGDGLAADGLVFLHESWWKGSLGRTQRESRSMPTSTSSCSAKA